MPTLSMGQACAPPVFTYPDPVHVDKRDNCNDMRWGSPAWSRTVNKQAGAGGTLTFTVDVPPRSPSDVPLNSGGKVDVRCDGIVIDSYYLAYGPQHSDRSVTVPSSSATSVTLDFYPNSNSNNGLNRPEDCKQTIIPAFDISKIAFATLTSTPPRLAIPQVSDVELCGADIAHLQVANSSPQADYYWFTDPNASTEAHRGTTYDLPVVTSTQLYVQAIPSTGFVGCASERKAVNIIVHDASAAFSIDASFSGPAPYLQSYAIGFLATSGYDTYTWDWGDNTPPERYTTTNAATHAYAQIGSYDVTLTVYKAYPNVPGGGCSATSKLPGLVVVASLCEIQALAGGEFQHNVRSGAISYVAPDASCLPTISFECLSEEVNDGHNVAQVVAASATAFADQLVVDPNQTSAVINPYLAGQWRIAPQASYSFRTSLKPDSDPKNYSFGTFTLRPFDWESSLRARPTAWLTAAVTEQLSPNGEVLQERDPLGVPSTAKFGYGVTPEGTSAHVLPYLQAHNAESQAVLFESFESSYASAGVTSGEDELLLPSDVQLIAEKDKPGFIHTGSKAALLTARQLVLKPIPLTPQLNAKGLLIKLWVRLEDYVPTQFSAFVDLQSSSTGPGASALTPLTSNIRIGNWLLFEAQVPMGTSGVKLGEKLTPVLRFSSVGASSVYVDDVRVQPAEAQMTAYVYDPISLRLLASFDDQHFALRYQYNAEGKLIRKQADTMQGLKTLQETHYHTPATNQVNE